MNFYNGAYIQFSSLRGSADTDTTYDKILSTEWGHIFVDEVSEVDEKSIDVLRTRLSQKMDVRNKLLFALNPTRKTGWTYTRFFKHLTRDGIALAVKTVQSFLVVQFKLDDNKEHISDDYEDDLQNMSALMRKRFLDGDYYDDSEGEVFRTPTWGAPPENAEWESLVVYTDPSAKESKNNDFKASVLLGKAKDPKDGIMKIWLLNVLAVQGTSREMLENIWELYNLSPIPEITRIWMENKQVPLDFKVTFEAFQAEKGWICPLEWDNRKTGDKFTFIESTLEPLYSSGKFVFNEALRETHFGEMAVNQFLFFSRKVNVNKDDIPDACAKGASLLNRTGSVTTGFKDKPRLVKRTKLTI